MVSTAAWNGRSGRGNQAGRYRPSPRATRRHARGSKPGLHASMRRTDRNLETIDAYPNRRQPGWSSSPGKTCRPVRRHPRGLSCGAFHAAAPAGGTREMSSYGPTRVARYQLNSGTIEVTNNNGRNPRMANPQRQVPASCMSTSRPVVADQGPGDAEPLRTRVTINSYIGGTGIHPDQVPGAQRRSGSRWVGHATVRGDSLRLVPSRESRLRTAAPTCGVEGESFKRRGQLGRAERCPSVALAGNRRRGMPVNRLRRLWR